MTKTIAVVVLTVCLGLPRLLPAQSAPAVEPGSVAWLDLLTDDLEAARDFYAVLFGWEYERFPSGNYLAMIDGVWVGGVSRLGSSSPAVNESRWLIGVAVADLEASLQAARRLGGAVLQDVTHTDGMAEWSVIRDPWGAELLLLVPERPLAAMASVVGAGAWAWVELWTDEPEAAARFYEEVVGWDPEEVDRGDGVYTAFEAGGSYRAGIVDIGDLEIESAWAPYAAVADIERTLERAVELGGEMLLEPSEENYGGSVAILADPTGVGFLVVEIAEDAQ